MTDVRDQTAPTLTGSPANAATGGFIWYELISQNPEASKTFYDAVVGWNVGPAVEEFQGYRMIGRSDGKSAGGVMQLTDEMKQHGARPIWLGYIHVADVDQSVASIERAGGKAYMAPFDIPNVGRIAMVADPSGAPFYVMKPIPPANDPNAQSDVFSPDQAQHVRWIELSCDDQDGAVDFYKRQFGWAQDGDMDMGEMGKYRFIQANGVTIGAIMRKPPQLPVSMWTYYIGVDDIDRAVEAVRSGGGQVFHGPNEIPGGEYSLNGMDPQGAAFALVGRRSS
jgi:predicted enzyme related to lactoylglutathione lyase